MFGVSASPALCASSASNRRYGTASAALPCLPRSNHSKIGIRLSADQLIVLRRSEDGHGATNVGSKAGIQGTIRAFPESFLASSVIVCEGESEVGLLRGVDQFRTSEGSISMTAIGASLVDANGCDNLYKRANAFRNLGYRTTVVRDDDKQPSGMMESIFVKMHGPIFKWRAGRALEDELFISLSSAAVLELLEYAIELHGEVLV